MNASAYVQERGTAVVLGAGGLVITPVAGMLHERLPDGGLKYEKIILVEIGGMTGNAISDMVKNGEITPEESQRLKVTDTDATLVLKGLTTEIDGIMGDAVLEGDRRHEPPRFPAQRINGLLKELTKPLRFGRFAPPAGERPLPDESVTFAVLAMATQDFASPIKDYLDVWAKRFELTRSDEKTLDRWEKKGKEIEQRLGALIVTDMWRMLKPGGVAFYAEPVAMEAGKPGGDIEREAFFGEEGLAAVVPKSLPFKVLRKSTWNRPLNNENLDEGEIMRFLIEGLTMKKGEKG